MWKCVGPIPAPNDAFDNCFAEFDGLFPQVGAISCDSAHTQRDVSFHHRVDQEFFSVGILLALNLLGPVFNLPKPSAATRKQTASCTPSDAT